MTSNFALDRSNAKAMGVCAGIARMTGADVTFVRLAVVVSLFVLGPLTILLYIVAGCIAPDAD
jgi:phage shock protein C